jgi:hypothetical protein
MQNADIYICNLLDSGCGFAARIDNGEQVFIPASVIKASSATEGTIATAKLLPNTHPNNAATPWVAVHVGNTATAHKTPTAAEEDADTFEAVVELGYASTLEIASEIEADVTQVHASLMRLFTSGKVAKAEVYARGQQNRVAFYIWATDAAYFLDGSS